MTSEKEEKVFKVSKVGGDKFEFYFKSPDIERTEIVSQDKVREHYKKQKEQKNELMEQLKKINKDLKNISLEEDQELANFIKLANRAADYHKMTRDQETRTSILNQLENLDKEIGRLELAAPELKRIKSD